MLKVSVPTRQQVVHGVERALLVFVGTTATVWIKSTDPFGKAAILGAVGAGAVAVYQALLSTFTSL